ncbi:MAG: polyphosphate kinase 2 family protein [Candidatus Elarobacter sp.]
MDYRAKFRVPPDTKVRLADIDAGATGKHADPAAADPVIRRSCERLRELQDLLYAEAARSVLIVLQAMDTGGKDGTMDHVLGSMNPQGAYVHAFKVPSAEEAAHDFLWRAHRVAPAHGQIAIFNRSHYEDVLVTRVHDLVPKAVWSKRYDRINEFEKNLVQSGTHILKFFLHISPEEQLQRFKQRLDDPHKQWKISESDYTERAYWDEYTKAYEAVLERTSTQRAPWFIIPANHKWFRNLAVSRIVVEALAELGMHYPAPSVDLEDIAQKYHAAAESAHATNHGATVDGV